MKIRLRLKKRIEKARRRHRPKSVGECFKALGLSDEFIKLCTHQGVARAVLGKQERLGPPFEAILMDNIWELYIKSPEKEIK